MKSNFNVPQIKRKNIALSFVNFTYYMVFLLSSIGRMPLPEWLFNTVNVVLILAALFLDVMSTIGFIVTYNEAKRDVRYRLEKNLEMDYDENTIKRLTRRRIVSQVNLIKDTPQYKAPAISMLINFITNMLIIAIVSTKFLGYSVFSWAFVVLEAIFYVAFAYFAVIGYIIRKLAGYTSKELVILSFLNDDYKREIAKEFKDVIDAIRLEADSDDPEAKRERKRLTKFYYDLVMA